MINKIIVLTLLLSSSFIGMASASEDMKQRIDEIKMNMDYLYEEDFGEEEEASFAKALNKLLLSTNELRLEQGKPQLELTHLNPFIKRIRYVGVDYKSAFVYVSVEDILGVKNVAAAPIGEETVVTPEPPAPTTPPVYQPSKSVAVNPRSDHEELVSLLVNQDNWNEIGGILSRFKDQGKIRELGKCKDKREIPEDASAILLDGMLGIMAHFSPKNNANRINYRTNLPDNEENYSDYRVIVWYR